MTLQNFSFLELTKTLEVRISKHKIFCFENYLLLQFSTNSNETSYLALGSMSDQKLSNYFWIFAKEKFCQLFL